VVELVDTLVSEASAERLRGSSPLLRTSSMIHDRNSFLSTATGRYKLRIAAAWVCTFILAVSTALVSLSTGPMLQLMLDSTGQTYTLDSLFGPLFGKFLSIVFSESSLSRSLVVEWLSWFLLSMASLKALAYYFQWSSWELISERAAYDWREQLVAKFLAMDSRARSLESVIQSEANLGSTMTNDIRLARDYIVHFYGGLPREGLLVAITALSIFMLSPKLFLLFFLGVAPVVLLLARFGKKLRRRTKKALNDQSELVEWTQQRFLGAETILHCATQDDEIKKFEEASLSMMKKYFSSARAKAQTSPAIEFFGIGSMAFVLWISLKSIYSEQLAPAVLMSFFTGLAFLSQSASKFGKYLNSIQEGRIALGRLIESVNQFALSGPQLEVNAQGSAALASFEVKLVEGPVSFEIKDLKLNYGSLSKSSLGPLSLDLIGGKIYGVAGPSGSGKSSLFNAILGVGGSTSGSMVLSVDQNYAKKSPVKRPLTYLPQQEEAIHVSLAHNVSYPDIEYDSVKVEEALKRAKFLLHLDAKRCAQGIQSLVGPNGLMLSGGELQRLQLARVFYHNNPLILIDEGTSALDLNLESEVLEQLKLLSREGFLVLMIAHRPAALKVSDVVIRLRDGQLQSIES
jgi:ABC-type multidrug transport system fused ATPase/permease subunit